MNLSQHYDRLRLIASDKTCWGKVKEIRNQHYVFDHRIIEKVENAVLALGAIRKDSHNPLFVADRPWEAWLDNLYGNILHDEEEALFRLWYSPFLYHKFAPGGKLNEDGKNESGLCYAYSKDGLEWIKPELGVVEFEGSKRNNLVMRKAHGFGVMKDPHGEAPEERFRMFFKVQGGDKSAQGFKIPAGIASSPDGIHWRADPFADMPFWPGKWGDTHNNFFWDERLQRYVLLTRTWTDIPGNQVRLVARMESPEFRTWSRPVDILRELPSERGRRQTYAMPSFPCDGITLGFLMLINTEEGNRTVDCELVWSPDTWHWHRICPGSSILPRGPEGSCDFGTIYAAQSPIITEKEIMIFYGGFDRPHDGYRKGSLCLACLRPDGWAGYAPQDKCSPACLTTKPIPWSGKRLRVSADCGDGYLKAAVIDGEGRSLEECETVRGEATRRPVAWKDDKKLPSLEGENVRLRFQLTGAKLYAFGFD